MTTLPLPSTPAKSSTVQDVLVAAGLYTNNGQYDISTKLRERLSHTDRLHTAAATERTREKLEALTVLLYADWVAMTEAPKLTLVSQIDKIAASLSPGEQSRRLLIEDIQAGLSKLLDPKQGRVF